uniref:Uncharacterized protein n=1 Tax=Timema bartmani TaxID=61472 RepID=A0A7R9EZB4_9NEOP|nr:unnamed protein product [Timema bartmani]
MTVQSNDCATFTRLLVVSTKVGGIPEVLPPELIYLTEPNVPFFYIEALLLGLETAIANLKAGKVVSPIECHKRVKSLYNWMNVTQRTEIVYNTIAKEKSKTLGAQLRNYLASGAAPFLLVVSLCYLVLQVLEWLVPTQQPADTESMSDALAASRCCLSHWVSMCALGVAAGRLSIDLAKDYITPSSQAMPIKVKQQNQQFKRKFY